MKSITLVFIIFSLLTACHSSSKMKKEKANTQVPQTESNLDESNNQIAIEIVSDHEIKLKNTEAVITIYGYDQLLADASASVITTKTIEIKEVPTVVNIAIPDNPSALIQPALSSKENAKYYLTFYCDSNQNKKDDEGDIKLDYDKMQIPDIDIESEGMQTIYIKEYWN